MRLALCTLLAAAVWVSPAGAAELAAITLMASGRADATMAEAIDLADALVGGGALRIIPMAGEGPVQALTDLLKLDGVGAAVLPADTLAYVEAHGLLPDARRRVSYIAKTGGAEIHVLARGGIKTLAELGGKRVNLGAASEARFVSGSLLLETLGIAVTPTATGMAEAMAQLQKGEIDALVFTARKPSPALAGLKAVNGLRLLPIPMTDALATIYAPQVMTDADYPQLVAKGEAVETLAVSHVLAVLNWKQGSARYRQLDQLATALFENTATLQSGRRLADWRGINFAAGIPGWTRHGAAERGIAEAPEAGSEAKEEFRAFIAENAVAGEDEAALFARFVEWQKNQGKGN